MPGAASIPPDPSSPGQSRRLPADPDLPSTAPADTETPARATPRRGSRPTHLRPGPVGLVLAGGAVGAPLRYLISRTWPTTAGGFPWATATINVAGAFLLGLLLEALARDGVDTGARRALRLLIGTGILGAFTTYSTLAVEADLLVRAHADTRSTVYAAGSVAAGLLAALAGIITAAAGHRAASIRAPGPRAATGTGDPGSLSR